MITHHPIGEIVLRCLAIFLLIFAWLPVFFPRFRFRHKGGNRAPLSKKSMWLFTVTATSWALVVWGLWPWMFSAIFAAAFLCGMVLSRRDRKAYDRKTGVHAARPGESRADLDDCFSIRWGILDHMAATGCEESFLASNRTGCRSSSLHGAGVPGVLYTIGDSLICGPA